MLKKTSLEGLVIEHNDRPPHANLADFDIDGAELKPIHKQWLDERIIFLVRARAIDPAKGRWLIHLRGRASQSGSDAHNLVLSIHRNDVVIEYLKKKLPGEPLIFDSLPVGESDSFNPKEWEYELDRSVVIEIELIKNKPFHIPVIKLPKIKPFKPKLVYPKKKIKPVINDYTLRVVKATKFEIKPPAPLRGPHNELVYLRLYIEIRDNFTGDLAYYEFNTFDPGLKISSPISRWGKMKKPISYQIYEDGRPHNFKFAGAMGAHDLDGVAEYFETPLIGNRFTIFADSRISHFKNVVIKPLDLGKPRYPAEGLKVFEITSRNELEQVSSPPAWVVNE